MNVHLSEESRRFVADQVTRGRYPSEEAVLEEALCRMRQQERAEGELPSLEDLIDYDAIASCEREADDRITLEEVRAATSKINDSMARVVIEEERAERF
jgi:putative addiction module CopG family antidote